MHPLDLVLSSTLAPFEVYAVGGRVRDEVRAQIDGVRVPPKDLDYVVIGMSAADLVARLGAIGRVDIVGAAFAVVKFRHALGEADVALPRRERSTGSGHRDFTVESGPTVSLADDLGRRDFRMNMLAKRVADDKLVDPYDGAADIAARRIDIAADATFEEDPLRMLRAAQFAARFGFELSGRALRAMRAAAGLIVTVSAERVGDELTKLLRLARRPSVGLELLRETGVLAHLFPELLEGEGVEQNEWHAYDVYRHNLATVDAAPPGDLTLRLAALLHDVGKPRTKDGPHFYRHEHVGADLVVPMLGRLMLPKTVVHDVTELVRHHMYTADPELSPKAIRRFIYRVEPSRLERLFALRAADIAGSGLPKRDDANERFEARVREIAAQAPAASVRDLRINGRDVMALMQQLELVPPQFGGDRRVGQILSELFERVMDDPACNEREFLLDAARTLLRSSGPTVEVTPGTL